MVQACVRPPARLLGTSTCHIEDDSDDEATAGELEQKETSDDTSEGVSHQPSFQESEEEEEEEEVVEVVKPKKKKKVVRRKKT